MTLIESYRLHNPLGFRDLFRKRSAPTSVELALFSLEQTRLDLLQAEQELEQAQAARAALIAREQRLVTHVRDLMRVRGEDAAQCGQQE